MDQTTHFLISVLNYSFEAHLLAQDILKSIHLKDFDGLFSKLDNWFNLLEIIDENVTKSKERKEAEISPFYVDILKEVQKSLDLLNAYTKEIEKGLTGLQTDLKFEIQENHKTKKHLSAYALGSVK